MEGGAEKRLHRSSHERMFAGVAGGLGEYFDVDPVFFRLAFVLTAFFGGTGVLAYIALAIIMPPEGRTYEDSREIVRDNINDMERNVRDATADLRGWAQPGDSIEEDERRARRRRTAGAVLLLLGFLFLLGNLNVFFWFRWDYLWPLVLIGLGLAILVGQRRR